MGFRFKFATSDKDLKSERLCKWSWVVDDGLVGFRSSWDDLLNDSLHQHSTPLLLKNQVKVNRNRIIRSESTALTASTLWGDETGSHALLSRGWRSATKKSSMKQSRRASSSSPSLWNYFMNDLPKPFVKVRILPSQPFWNGTQDNGLKL